MRPNLELSTAVEDAVTHSYRMRALVDSGTVLGLFLCLLGALLGASGAAALGEVCLGFRVEG
jgi:hypothetical protein